MKAIVINQNKDGSYDEVGMNNRRVISGSKDNIIKKAKDLFGKNAKIEFYAGDNIYGEPFETMILKESKYEKYLQEVNESESEKEEKIAFNTGRHDGYYGRFDLPTEYKNNKKLKDLYIKGHDDGLADAKMQMMNDRD